MGIERTQRSATSCGPTGLSTEESFTNAARISAATRLSTLAPVLPRRLCTLSSQWAAVRGFRDSRGMALRNVSALWDATPPKRARAPCRSARSRADARGWASASSPGPYNRSSGRDSVGDRYWRALPPRVGIEASARPQANQQLCVASLEPLLQLHRTIAGLKYEKWDAARRGQPIEQPLHRLGSDLVCVLTRMGTARLHRSDPAGTGEAQLSNELVGPSGDDRLAV